MDLSPESSQHLGTASRKSLFGLLWLIFKDYSNFIFKDYIEKLVQLIPIYLNITFKDYSKMFFKGYLR